jgi:hypothetical protein
MSFIIDGTSGLTFNNATTQASAGVVLQVLSVTKVDTYSIANTNTFTDITGLTVTITPKFATSKILIIGYIGASSQANGGTGAFRFARNGTGVGVGTASGSRQGAGFRFPNGANADSNLSYGGLSMNYLDSPATTSATTYSFQMISQTIGGASTTYINFSQADTNTADSYGTRAASTITVMEIAG